MNKMPAQTVNNIYLSKEMYIKLGGERYTRAPHFDFARLV